MVRSLFHLMVAPVAATTLLALPAGATRLCLQAGEIDGPTRQAVAAALQRHELQAVGADEPCDIQVRVDVERTGYRLSAQLLARDGQQLAAEEVSGDVADVFDLVDRLGQRLARDLDGQTAPGTVTIGEFANRAEATSAPFVSGIPHMLSTVLRQHRTWTLVEAPPAGNRLDVDATIAGQFAQLQRFELEGTVRATGRSLGVFESQGPGGETAPLDAVVAQLAAAIEDHRRTQRAVAVLPFVNHVEEDYGGFVDGLADMLMTSLGQAPQVTVIERVQIETAMRNASVELSGPIDSETAARVGAWLGADAVVLGSFLRFGPVFRIDARMIDAETGEVLAADRATGAEEDVVHMVDELGQRLVERFAERSPVEAAGTGHLEVLFRMTKAEMGERPAYFHLVRLYVDGQLLETSPVVRDLDRWHALFSRRLSSGAHRVRLVHGFVSDGEWDGRMPLQPEEVEMTIEPGSTATLRYSFEVGWFNDRFQRDP